MKLINYEPYELWDLFIDKRDFLLTHESTIAENPEFDVMIFLTAEDCGDMALPTIVVWMENREVYRESAIGKHDLVRIAEKIYNEFLPDEKLIKKYLDDDADIEKMSEEIDLMEMQDAIDDREGELYDAASDFLYVVTGGKLEKLAGYKESEEITNDIVNRVCEFLHEEYDISVYRPMIIEDENGEEFFEEFPYDVLTFDD